MSKSRRGLTLIEVLIATALVVITAGIGIILLNPAGQFAQARNTQRQLELQGVMNAVRQNIADATTGVFSCSSGPLPTTAEIMSSATGTGNYNIAPCLVPEYLQTMPFDPLASSADYISNTNYDTDYTIVYNPSTTEITVAAPYAELGTPVSITR